MNCKPGDLAIVIQALPEHQDVIGRIVNVLAWDSAEADWEIGFSGALPASCEPYAHIFCADDSLRPVSGLPDTEDTDTEQPIKEVA